MRVGGTPAGIPTFNAAASHGCQLLHSHLHESRALEPLVCGIPPIRSRRGPRRRRPAKLHADKGYDFDHLRLWLRHRNIVPRIARRSADYG